MLLATGAPMRLRRAQALGEALGSVKPSARAVPRKKLTRSRKGTNGIAAVAPAPSKIERSSSYSRRRTRWQNRRECTGTTRSVRAVGLWCRHPTSGFPGLYAHRGFGVARETFAPETVRGFGEREKKIRADFASRSPGTPGWTKLFSHRSEGVAQRLGLLHLAALGTENARRSSEPLPHTGAAGRERFAHRA